MIIGIGSDIIEISRIAEQLQKSGEKFQDKCFTSEEIEASFRYSSENKKAVISHFAKRFAAKEAFAKACGRGIGKNIGFKDIVITNDSFGKPGIILSEKGQNFVNKLSGDGFKGIFHLTISDSEEYAMAVVVIEAVQLEGLTQH